MKVEDMVAGKYYYVWCKASYLVGDRHIMYSYKSLVLYERQKPKDTDWVLFSLIKDYDNVHPYNYEMDITPTVNSIQKIEEVPEHELILELIANETNK